MCQPTSPLTLDRRIRPIRGEPPIEEDFRRQTSVEDFLAHPGVGGIANTAPFREGSMSRHGFGLGAVRDFFGVEDTPEHARLE